MVAILSRTSYSCSQHLSSASAKLSELGHRREAVKIMLKLAAIKRIFAEDSITPEERQENLLEVPRVRSHATEKTHAPTHLLSWYHRFRKTPFSECFHSRLKRKAGVVKFFRFEERFREAPCRDDLVLNGRRTHRNKAAFSNSSELVWTALNISANVFTEHRQIHACQADVY